jgi:hypothetical protein
MEDTIQGMATAIRSGRCRLITSLASDLGYLLLFLSLVPPNIAPALYRGFGTLLLGSPKLYLLRLRGVVWRRKATNSLVWCFEYESVSRASSFWTDRLEIKGTRGFSRASFS